MRKSILLFVTFLVLTGLVLSSCFTYTVDRGDGPQSYIETEKINNHYLLLGLVKLKAKQPVEPKSGTSDYRMITKHTFINGLVSVLTLGIYMPTSTRIVE